MTIESREFKLRHLIIFTATLILAGFTGAHLLQKTLFDPTRPEVREKILNASIEQTLCQSIERDLETFKQSPLNFVRSDLETLIAEATKILEKIGLNAEEKPSIKAANIILDLL